MVKFVEIWWKFVMEVYQLSASWTDTIPNVHTPMYTIIQMYIRE